MNLEQLTEQQIFDAIWDHFITKGNGPGMRKVPRMPTEEVDSQICSYQGPCAVGIFLRPSSRVDLDNAGATVEDVAIFIDTVTHPEWLGQMEEGNRFQLTGTLGMSLTNLLQEELRFLYENAELLSALQDAHDMASTLYHPETGGITAFHAKLINDFTAIAKDRELEVPQ